MAAATWTECRNEAAGPCDAENQPPGTFIIGVESAGVLPSGGVLPAAGTLMYSTVTPRSVPLPSQAKILTVLGVRRHTEPEVFTFEPIPERKYGRRYKRRSIKVLYPIYQPRRTRRTEKDVAKRLLLCLLSIVILQVYLATDLHLDEVSALSGGADSGTGSDHSLLDWPLWRTCSTSFLKSPQGVQANASCPTAHPSQEGGNPPVTHLWGQVPGT
ncbi:uncharacterized protein [Narcine bancroftii]|uniref:uncharacterized protein n=1 Tax=Narcine bancroftii TaxID=1343680 RepID=UPI003831680C